MIDSEPFHLQSFNAVLKKFGDSISESENKRYIGLSDKDAAVDIVKQFNLPISPEELVLQKGQFYKKILTKKVKSQAGLKSLLKSLSKKDYKLAIASGSHLDEIQTVVNKLGIADYFDVFVSSDKVKQGKPHPDIYLSTASKLLVKPEECLVLEDAYNGLKSAKAAGMICYVIPSNETVGQDFSTADKLFKSLKEVNTFLAKSNKPLDGWE